jgi:hypothetical protein
MRTPRFALIAALFLTLGLSSACDAILGIQDAQPDPLATGGGGAGVPDTLCGEYCATVMANCTIMDAQYSSVENCLATCPSLPGATDASEVGNTVGCRLKNARDAATVGPLTECPAAGPGSEGICGDNCEAFCRLFEVQCSDLFNEDYMSVGQPGCRDDCETFPDAGTFSVTATNQGDTVQCRLYHVSQAFDDPVQHCLHAAGNAVCISGDGGGGSGRTSSGGGGAGGS